MSLPASPLTPRDIQKMAVTGWLITFAGVLLIGGACYFGRQWFNVPAFVTFTGGVFLPLGVGTYLLWQMGERTVAVLMAIFAGLLLWAGFNAYQDSQARGVKPLPETSGETSRPL